MGRGDPNPRIAIIGGRPGGLCMAVRLAQQGFDDFVLLEQAQRRRRHLVPQPLSRLRVRHPVPSLLVLVRDQARLVRDPYAPQAEILDYMEHVAQKYGVLPHCRFGSAVRGATWDEDAGAVDARSRIGRDRSRPTIVVSAIGMFNELVRPRLRARFVRRHELPLGPLALGPRPHRASRRGDRQRGERGAVRARDREAGGARVRLFQRTANWVLPKLDTPYTEEELARFRTDPDASLALRSEIYDQVDRRHDVPGPAGARADEAAGLGAIEHVRDPRARRKLRADPSLSAASARWSRTTTTPRSTARTSSSSPIRSRGSSPMPSSLPTDARAASTR
jgi:cation diffusion facilitator CzcD-associated flavoprotein CzcO